MSTLPAVATRGREFAIARLSHVVGNDVKIIIGRPIGTVLADAERAAAAIDWRLQPYVILLDRAA